MSCSAFVDPLWEKYSSPLQGVSHLARNENLINPGNETLPIVAFNFSLGLFFFFS